MGKTVEKIAFVHDFLFTFGGAERMLQVLHKAYPEVPIYTTFTRPEIVAAHFPEATIITSSLQKHPLRHLPQLLLTAYPKAIEEFDFSEFTTVVSLSGAFSHGIIIDPTTRHICYCHSPMRYAWDWQAEYAKEHGYDKNALRQLFMSTILHNLRLWDQITSSRPDIWIANSQTVANRIAKYYRKEAEVINPPVTPPNLAAINPTEKRLKRAVTVSRLTPNKRIELLIEACARVKLPLDIVGTGTDLPRLQNLAKKQGREVLFHGGLDEVAKTKLLSEATVFLFAAEDDFGIAPTEALLCGTPVIAYGKGGVAEAITPGENGSLFLDVDELEKKLTHFLEMGVKLSPEEIAKRAEKYTTPHFLKQFDNLLSHAS